MKKNPHTQAVLIAAFLLAEDCQKFLAGIDRIVAELQLAVRPSGEEDAEVATGLMQELRELGEGNVDTIEDPLLAMRNENPPELDLLDFDCDEQAPFILIGDWK